MRVFLILVCRRDARPYEVVARCNNVEIVVAILPLQSRWQDDSLYSRRRTSLTPANENIKHDFTMSGNRDEGLDMHAVICFLRECMS